MKKLFKLSGLITVLILVLAGCGIQPILNINQNPVEVKKGTSNDAIYKAIKTAGLSKGWVVTKTSNGVAKAVLNIREHQAIVRINYTDKDYSINYVSSVNLNSDGTTIHSNYNGWIGYLKQAIDVQLSSLAE